METPEEVEDYIAKRRGLIVKSMLTGTGAWRLGVRLDSYDIMSLASFSATGIWRSPIEILRELGSNSSPSGHGGCAKAHSFVSKGDSSERKSA